MTTESEKGLFSSAAKFMVSAGRWAHKVRREKERRFGRQYWSAGPENEVTTLMVVIGKLLDEVEAVTHDNTGWRAGHYKGEPHFGKLKPCDAHAIQTILLYRQDPVFGKMHKGQLLEILAKILKETP